VRIAAAADGRRQKTGGTNCGASPLAFNLAQIFDFGHTQWGDFGFLIVGVSLRQPAGDETH
jgi:hypothetical protein